MTISLRRRWLASAAGNVTTLYALMAPILIFATGAAIDYGRAAQMHSKLNAAADAAALAALTPAMLQKDATTAQAAATSMFEGLASQMQGLSGTAVNVTIAAASDSLTRNVTVTYSTEVATIFAAVLGKDALAIQGSSQASARIPPNIDFYVLLDNSPSMALPATQAGVTQMISLTKNQDGGKGCAFACHQADTSAAQTDTIYNSCYNSKTKTYSTPTKDGNGHSKAYCDTSKGLVQLDNYALAVKNGITMRLDELTAGVAMLLNTASTTASSSQFATPPRYQFAIYSMDSLWSIGLTQLVALTSDYTNQWSSNSSKFGVMNMYRNNATCKDSACSAAGSQGDVATDYDGSLGTLSKTSYIPDPGKGTNQSGDAPQKVLFIVTDGVEDRQSGSSRIQQAMNNLGSAPGGNSNSTNWCDTIKKRNVKIAVLYTEYLPVTTNDWYNAWIKPFQPSIAPALQACASPGLFYNASIGADLGAALSSLFAAVTHTGHLTN